MSVTTSRTQGGGVIGRRSCRKVSLSLVGGAITCSYVPYLQSHTFWPVEAAG